MLHPREVIARAEAAWREGRVPLAAAEGFIRQVLGWREYVRGVYWAGMPGYAEQNVLGHALPCRRGSGTVAPACAAWRTRSASRSMRPMRTISSA
jgi:deoxyribodipyrimidine photolyase-like uncharacterized protein